MWCCPSLIWKWQEIDYARIASTLKLDVHISIEQVMRIDFFEVFCERSEQISIEFAPWFFIQGAKLKIPILVFRGILHPNVDPEGANCKFESFSLCILAQKSPKIRENMKSLNGDTVNPLKPLQVIHYPAFFPSLIYFAKTWHDGMKKYYSRKYLKVHLEAWFSAYGKVSRNDEKLRKHQIIVGGSSLDHKHSRCHQFKRFHSEERKKNLISRLFWAF